MTKIIEIPECFEELFTPKRYKVFKGGRGGAKSESIGRSLLIIAMQKKTRILCTREFQASIKESVYKLLVDLIDLYELSGFTATIDRIRHKNGSEFIFKGLKNNINSIKSMFDIDICWVEEAHTISKESLDVLLPTIRAKGSEIWFSYNPEEEDDPVSVQFPESDNEAIVKQVNWSDNPYFPEVLNNERLRCLKYKPDDYGHIWEGKTKKFGTGLVVKNFTDENIKNINYLPEQPLHICCDFNVDPMCWILAHKTENKIFFFDEIIIEDTTTIKTVEEFYSRYPDHKGGIIINGDASGNNRSTQSEYANYVLIKNRLSSLGYSDIKIHLKGWNPPVKNRIAAWNEKVVNLDGERCILIAPRCKWLLYNMKKLKYKEGTSIVDVPTSTMIKKNKELKFLEHPFDAASYPVDYYWPIKMDYPPPEKRPLTIVEQFKQSR